MPTPAIYGTLGQMLEGSCNVLQLSKYLYNRLRTLMMTPPPPPTWHSMVYHGCSFQLRIEPQLATIAELHEPEIGREILLVRPPPFLASHSYRVPITLNRKP